MTHQAQDYPMRHKAFAWVVPGCWFVITATAGTNSSLLAPTPLLVLGLAQCFLPALHHPVSSRILRNILAALAIIFCYHMARDWHVAISWGSSREITVVPAQVILGASAVVGMIILRRPPKAQSGKAARAALFLVLLLLSTVAVGVSLVLLTLHAIDLYLVFRDLARAVVELALLVFIVIRLVPCLGRTAASTRSLGTACVIAAGSVWVLGSA